MRSATAMNNSRTTPPPAPKPSRMTLASVTKGKLQTPYRIVGFGPEGIGKTTFAAGAPSPIFLGAEEGSHYLDVARFPKPETFADVLDALRTLYKDEHDFRTLVVDTLDHLEPLIWAQVCKDDGSANIEEVGGGFQKGYQVALDYWRRVIAAVEQLQRAKGMNIVLLAHSHIRTFRNPEGEDFDRYELKVHPKAAGFLKEWADYVLFMRQETLVHKQKSKKAKGVATGARLIYTERSAAFDAKHRGHIPDTLPLDWGEFHAAVEADRPADPSALQAEIRRKAAQLGEDLEKTILATLEKAGDDPQRLALLNNRVNAKLAELADANDPAEPAEKEQQ